MIGDHVATALAYMFAIFLAHYQKLALLEKIELRSNFFLILPFYRRVAGLNPSISYVFLHLYQK